MQPWDAGAWNLPRLRKWARRAPLHAVLTLDKLEDREVVLLSCCAMGFAGKIINMRHSYGTRHSTPDGLRRAVRYMKNKVVSHMQHECGRRFASLRDETGSSDAPS